MLPVLGACRSVGDLAGVDGAELLELRRPTAACVTSVPRGWKAIVKTRLFFVILMSSKPDT